MTHSAKNHYVYLDAIRGLAALTVFSEHYVIAYGLPCESTQCKYWLDFSPLHIWWDGMAAVSMFFVLSGLVLSLKYFDEQPELNINSFSLSHYLFNRCVRIWYPYAITLCISAVLYWCLVLTPPQNTPLPASEWITEMWRAHSLNLSDIAREFWLFKPPETLVLIPQAWTLSLELVISLMLPIALLLIRQGNFWLIFFSLFIVSFLGLPIFVFHFLLGLFIAKYRLKLQAQLKSKPFLKAILLVMGLGFYTSADTCYRFLDNSGIWISSGLGAALLLILCLSSHRIQAWLSWPHLQWLGKISYSLYLLHMVVVMWLSPLAFKWLASLVDQRVSLWLFGWIATLLCTLFFSTIFYYSIELPSIRFARRFSARLRNQYPHTDKNCEQIELKQG